MRAISNYQLKMQFFAAYEDCCRRLTVGRPTMTIARRQRRRGHRLDLYYTDSQQRTPEHQATQSPRYRNLTDAFLLVMILWTACDRDADSRWQFLVAGIRLRQRQFLRREFDGGGSSNCWRQEFVCRLAV